MKKRKNPQSLYPIWLIVVAVMTLGNMVLFMVNLAMSMWIAEALDPIRSRLDIVEIRSENNKQRILILEAENARRIERGRMPPEGAGGAADVRDAADSGGAAKK